MAVIFKPNGEVLCETVDEARQWAEFLRRDAKPSAKVGGATPSNGQRPFLPKSPEPLIKLLNAIQTAGGEIAAQQLAEQMGLKAAKGLGGYQAMANGLLRLAGLKVEDVFKQYRGIEGKSYWKAGPKIGEAINELRAAFKKSRASEVPNPS
jgi:hypothetical protein